MNLLKHARRLIPLFVLASAGVLGAASAAASVTTTTLEHIIVWSAGNLVYAYPTGGITLVASCGSARPYYSFSYSRPMAAAYLAALLAAQARGATVTIYGTGNCTDETISETLDYIEVS